MYKKEKLNKILQKELGQIILRELDLASDVMVTVTRVEVSLNGFFARVYISVLPVEKKEEIIRKIDRKIFFIQQQLNKKLKIRPVPKIEFVKEEKTEGAARVEELLKKIKDLEKNK